MRPYEYEQSLKKLEELEKTHSNFFLVEESIDAGCLKQLMGDRLVELVYSDKETELRGLPEDRYQRTYLGRSYFRDKRRKWLDANSGALIAAISSIASMLIGYAIGSAT